jgi:spermidine synthase
MVHGSTQHGMQRLNGETTANDTLYYAPDSGIAKAITGCRQSLQRPLHMGVIGLGTGSLLVHAQAGEQIEFYELSSAVEKIARSYFNYISGHQGQVQIHLGDGRRLLNQQLIQTGSKGFDLLVVDAFSGDAIPMHLLTVEALQLYRQHLLGDQAVIAIHITNRYLNLAPVVTAAAQQLGMTCLIVDSIRPPIAAGQDSLPQATPGNSDDSPLRWLILSQNANLPAWAGSHLPSRTQALPWTDSYGSLWSALR